MFWCSTTSTGASRTGDISLSGHVVLYSRSRIPRVHHTPLLTIRSDTVNSVSLPAHVRDKLSSRYERYAVVCAPRNRTAGVANPSGPPHERCGRRHQHRRDHPGRYRFSAIKRKLGCPYGIRVTWA